MNNVSSLSLFLFWMMMMMMMTIEVVSSFAASPKNQNQFQIQQFATDNDVTKARTILLQNAMNPLSISKDNMVVVYDKNDEDNDNDRIYFHL